MKTSRSRTKTHARLGLIAATALMLMLGACQREEPATPPAEPERGVVAEAEPEPQPAPEPEPTAERIPPARIVPVPEAVASLEELPSGVNVVQHEMRLLNTAMQNTLTLIAQGELSGIPAQIHAVHPAKVLTEKALKAGQYAPPHRGDQLEAFIARDEAFHDDLRRLLGAAKDGDLPATTAAYADLVQGCTGCHTQFRFAPPAR